MINLLLDRSSCNGYTASLAFIRLDNCILDPSYIFVPFPVCLPIGRETFSHSKSVSMSDTQALDINRPLIELLATTYVLELSIEETQAQEKVVITCQITNKTRKPKRQA